jgi:hypothetical protein
MRVKVVYVKPDKAKRVNEILVAEKEFMENEKTADLDVETKT